MIKILKRTITLMIILIISASAQDNESNIFDEIVGSPQIVINIIDKKIVISWDNPGILSKAKYQVVRIWKNIEKNEKTITLGNEETKVITLNSSTRTFEDTDVEIKIEYSYKVRLYIEDIEDIEDIGDIEDIEDVENNKVKGEKKVIINGETVIASDYSNIVKGKILPDIELIGVASGNAFLKLYKWEKDNWHEYNGIFKKDDVIKAENFFPNWKLIDVIFQDSKTVTKKYNIIVVNDKGTYEVKSVNKQVTIDTPSIIYENEEGIQQKIYMGDH